MNNPEINPPESYGTQQYFTCPVITLEKWQLMRRIGSDIPGHYRSMIFHQCEKAPYEVYMNGLSTNLLCSFCKELMPDEIQVIWTFMNHDLLRNR